MGSSQEAYVTIKYRLENNCSKPRLNDIGVRLEQQCFLNSLSSEPRLDDIGARQGQGIALNLVELT